MICEREECVLNEFIRISDTQSSCHIFGLPDTLMTSPEIKEIKKRILHNVYFQKYLQRNEMDFFMKTP